MYQYLAILDFEATCEKDTTDHEIIEFPTVIIDLKTNTIIDRFEQFVKPKERVLLSDFCKNLTSITQEQVDSGIPLSDALTRHASFMSKYPNNIFATCSD